MSDDPVDDLGRQLFAAARVDQAPAALRERLARRAAPRRAAELVSVPPPRSPIERRRRPVRWLVPAALAAAVAAAGLMLLQRTPPEAPPLISAEHRAPDVGPQAPEVEPRAEEPAGKEAVAPALVEPVEPAPPARPAPQPEKPPQRAADAPDAVPPAAPAAAAPSSNTLVEELDWLKRARVALRGGDSAGALELLQSFESKYPASDLKDEATLLQIESLAAAGSKTEAAALAERFVRNAPTSPLVDRARSFLPPASRTEPSGKERAP